MKMTILGQLPKTLRPENSRIELGEVAIQLLPFHWTQQSSQNDIPLKSHYLRKAFSNNPKTAETGRWRPVRSAAQFIQ